MKYKFIRIDCDNVGDKIELCLYELNIEKAQAINNLIRKSIVELSENLRKILNSEILLIGPDDILLKTEISNLNKNKLNKLKDDYFKKTGFTISIGIGNDIIEAMRNLDIAKRSGRNKIYGE